MLGRTSSAPQSSSSSHGPGESLRERRRLRRRRILTAFCILLGLVAGMLVWGLNQSSVRISRITVYGADQSFSDIAARAMQGSYLGLIPRDSTFFFPASRIRADIINVHPDIAAVSLFRNGLTGLSVRVDTRVAIARWCGASEKKSDFEDSDVKSDFQSDANCYVFDASGYIYAAAASTTETINSFALYAPLVGDTLEPLRATLVRADQLPAAFDFARRLGTLGSPVTRVILRDDEVDDMLASGTRITYVLGNEENAFTALVSADESLKLSSGSVEYVDLRFDGKVYVKRK